MRRAIVPEYAKIRGPPRNAHEFDDSQKRGIEVLQAGTGVGEERLIDDSLCLLCSVLTQVTPPGLSLWKQAFALLLQFSFQVGNEWCKSPLTTGVNPVGKERSFL